MGAPAHDDDRTASQRRADAAVEMGRRLLDGGTLPDVGGQKPHLVVNVDMTTLTREPGSRAAELAWAQPIPAETARRLACDAAITPLVNGEADHTSRALPGPRRHALVARDKGCRIPGCGAPSGWTDAHHIKHWADGGPNTLDNLVLLSRRKLRRPVTTLAPKPPLLLPLRSPGWAAATAQPPTSASLCDARSRRPGHGRFCRP